MTHDDEATVQPAVGTPVDQRVGRLEPERAVAGVLTALHDPVADALDDMAALGLHWTRTQEDADDKGVAGWLEEAEQRVKRRA